MRAATGARFAGEIVGFRGRTILSMMTEDPTGIRLGDVVTSLGGRPSVPVGPDMLGRVLDANGQPLDGMGAYRSTRMVEIDGSAPKALERSANSRTAGVWHSCAGCLHDVWAWTEARDFRR